MPEVIQNCFVKCGFSAARSVKLNMGGTARPHRLHQYFYKFRNIGKSVPTTVGQPTSLLSQSATLCT